jgi:regulator of sirC expression with transglutaminase-like and TPR domain
MIAEPATLARLRELCAGDGKRLDLFEAALIMGALRAGKPVELEPYRLHIRAMQEALARAARHHRAPSMLGEVIAEGYAYRGDNETYDDLQNADLLRVIERRKGLPVALAILYLHLARSQGWPAEGLNFPGHFLIRVELAGAKHVIDPFHDGAVLDGPELGALVRKVTNGQIDIEPDHFDPVPDCDVLLRLENNIRLRLAKREDWLGAALSLDRMLAIAPDRADLLFEAGQLNARLDRRRAAISAFERFLLLGGGNLDRELSRMATDQLQELRRGLN